MSDLDWQTESGEELEILAGDGRQASRRWRWIAAGALAFAAIALVLVWQMNQRAAGRGVQAESDLRAAYELWRAAVIAADREVLDAILEPDRSGWANVQLRLLDAGLAAAPARAVYAADPTTLPPAEQVAVSLGPDWQRAELTWVQPYEVDGDAPGAVQLQHTLLFRQAAGRWILGQPDPDFWGAQEQLDTELLRLDYPARDADFAERLGRDLEAALLDRCAANTANGACGGEQEVRLRLETDPAALLSLVEEGRPLIDGRDFVWPSPTLLGRPVDDDGYRALYAALAEPIIRLFAARQASPIALPAQQLQVICYAELGRLPRLFRYDPQADAWANDYPERAFRYQAVTPADDAAILVEFAGRQRVGRLQLAYAAGGRLSDVFDEPFSGLVNYPTGWTGTPQRPRLLLHGYGAVPTDTRFQLVDLELCYADGCAVRDVDGFPLWSPDGRRTLLLRNLELFLGDADGRPQIALGRGSSPFWLDSERFGYVAYAPDGGRTVVQVVVGRVADAETAVLFDSDGLAVAAGGRPGAPIFFNHLMTSPAAPGFLFGLATRYQQSQTQSLLFAARLEDGAAGLPLVADLAVRLALDGSPAGTPSLLSPVGTVPFVVAPGGRAISLAQLADPRRSIWRITVHRLEDGDTFSYSTGYPPTNFAHPYYDWSADGRWLAIVDDGFMRLIAPEYDYERLIMHDFRDCWHAAWINSPGG